MDKNNNRLYTNISSSYTDAISTYTTTMRLQTAHTFPITPKSTHIRLVPPVHFRLTSAAPPSLTQINSGLRNGRFRALLTHLIFYMYM